VKFRTIIPLAVSAVVLSSLSSASADPAPPDKPKRLEWTHPTFSTYEYVASGTMLAGLGAAMLLMKDEAPRWRGGVLMDDRSREFGMASTYEGRTQAARASDYLLYSMSVWPYLDAAVAMGGGHTQTGWQMSLINTQSFITNGLVTFLIKNLAGRERPNKTAFCTDNPNDASCGDSRGTGSFLSGHASTAFTGAGLVCAHHGAMPLYGNKIADAGACAVALAAATVTGGLRVVADKHYTSDVMAGAALGLASGWLMPKLLHYTSWGSGTTTDSAGKKKSGIAWSVAPVATRGGAMIMINGVNF
jgi:membrane-associated phospholipid phosphatase